MSITARKEIHKTIWRLELLVQCGHSLLAKRPVHEDTCRGVLRNVYCTFSWRQPTESPSRSGSFSRQLIPTTLSGFPVFPRSGNTEYRKCPHSQTGTIHSSQLYGSPKWDCFTKTASSCQNSWQFYKVSLFRRQLLHVLIAVNCYCLNHGRQRRLN